MLKQIIESNQKRDPRQNKRKSVIPTKQGQNSGRATGKDCAKIKISNQRADKKKCN